MTFDKPRKAQQHGNGTGLSGERGVLRGLDIRTDPDRSELEQVLAEELAVYEALVQHGERKKAALVAMNMPAVEAATVEEQKLLLALSALAPRRLKLMNQKTAEAGLRESTLTNLAGHLPRGERIAELAKQLRAVMRRAQRLNETNRMLIESALAVVGDFVRIVSECVSDQVSYAAAKPNGMQVFLDETA